MVFIFVIGLGSGVAIMTYGYKFGFRASYQIRGGGKPGNEDEKLFVLKKKKLKKEPAEFALLDENEDKD